MMDNYGERGEADTLTKYPCRFCAKAPAFRSLAQRNSHLFAKHRKRLKKCGVCCVAFPNATTLSLHTRHHVTRRSGVHRCSLCPKAFFDRARLAAHEPLHGYDRPDDGIVRPIDETKRQDDEMKCEVCDKTILGNANYKRHVKYHAATQKCDDKDKKYACEKCSTKFQSPIGLINHSSKRHPGMELFRCSLCESSFKRRKEFLAHVSDHRKDSTCIGGVIFNNIFTYNVESADTDLADLLANPTTRWPKSNPVGPVTAKKRKLKCPKCPLVLNRTSLNKHLELHRAEAKTFACHLCESKRFRTRTTRDFHVRAHFRRDVLTLCACGVRCRDAAELAHHKRTRCLGDGGESGENDAPAKTAATFAKYHSHVRDASPRRTIVNLDRFGEDDELQQLIGDDGTPGVTYQTFTLPPGVLIERISSQEAERRRREASPSRAHDDDDDMQKDNGLVMKLKKGDRAETVRVVSKVDYASMIGAQLKRDRLSRRVVKINRLKCKKEVDYAAIIEGMLGEPVAPSSCLESVKSEAVSTARNYETLVKDVVGGAPIEE